MILNTVGREKKDQYTFFLRTSTRVTAPQSIETNNLGVSLKFTISNYENLLYDKVNEQKEVHMKTIVM